MTGQLSGLQADRSDLLGGGRGLQADLLSSLHQRPDSPPNWITANLEQLTSDPLSPYGASSLIPAFNSLGLGAASRGGGGLSGNGRSQLGGGGGGGWGSSTATPPPGFSQHRAAGQLQPHYPGFGLNKGSEAQKIGGESLSLSSAFPRFFRNK